MTAYFAFQFAGQAQLDRFRADRHTAVDRALHQARGVVGFQQVVVADEACGEYVHRRGVEGFGVAALHDPALVHQEDTV